jgi:hypothetical protein
MKKVKDFGRNHTDCMTEQALHLLQETHPVAPVQAK